MFKWCNIKWFFTSYLWALDWYWYNDWLDSDAFWQIFQLWFWLLLNLCSHSLSLSYHLSPLPLARLIIAADTGHWSETPGALFGYQQCVSEMIMSHVLYTLMKYINNHNKVVLHLAHSIHVTHTIKYFKYQSQRWISLPFGMYLGGWHLLHTWKRFVII